MACTTIGLIGSNSCDPSIGGAAKAYVCKYSDITGFTVAAGLVTAITMGAVGSWKEWNPTQDRTAYLNATGQDPSKNNIFFDLLGFFKFAGTSKDAIKAANSIIQCCDLVVIWFLQNGTTLLQGVQFDAAGTGVVQSLEPARYVPNLLSGVGDEESKMEFQIKSKGKNLCVCDDAIIDEAYIEAL